MKKLLLLISFSFLCPFFSFAQEVDHVLGEVIIQMEYGQDIRSFLKEWSKTGRDANEIRISRELSPPLRIWLVEFDYASFNEQEVLYQIRQTRGVELAQFNHLGDYRQTVPDDPAFAQQWMWNNIGQSGGMEDSDIDVDLVWDLTTGGLTADGQEIVVCVIEGANRNHPDLQGNLWVNEAEIEGDGIDNDNNGYIDDYDGWHVNTNTDNIDPANHGTFVSGIVGAKGNNGAFVAGVNWDVKIMHVDFNGVSEANSVAAYTYPLLMRRKYNETGGQEGAFVVATNASWGIDGGNPDNAPIWCALYDTLGQAGILNCGATTNQNQNIDIIGDLPTACSSEFMISVTATNDEDERTFSGFGIEHVDVGAPGEDVISINLNGGPGNSSGTSFASPTVAGIIALMYAAPCSSIGAQALGAPQATAEMIRDAIYNTVDTIPSLQDEIRFGGRVNAFASMQAILQSCGPCPGPFGLMVTNVVDTSATFSWSSTDSTLVTNMLFRPAGATDWDTSFNVSSPILFDSLSACTDYEIRLEDLCAMDSSGYSAVFNFKTDGCCLPPEGLSVVDFTETSASISWNGLLAANSYNLLLVSGSDSVMYDSIQNTTFDLTNLDSCTMYTVQVQTNCDAEQTDFSSPVSFETIGCGNCTDLPYCPSNSADSAEEWIAEVSINTLNNLTDSDDGYGDYTSLSTDLTTNESYTINLAPGFGGFGFNEWFKVFLDFNQDGDFDDDGEEIFDAGGASNDPVQGVVCIPETAMEGSTRMRVVMKWNNEPTACEVDIEHGEVEDYCVNIIAGEPISCQTPVGIAVDTTTESSAELSWNNIGSALSYDVRLKLASNTAWTVIAAQDSFLTALNLTDCVEYEFQVRSVCSDCAGTESDWSSSTFFTTECILNADELLDGLTNWSVNPNPFTEALTVNLLLNESIELGVHLVDLNGRILYRQNGKFGVGESPIQISLKDTDIPAGIYFLKIFTDAGVDAKMIVKQ